MGINKIVVFSDLHIRLLKRHDEYRKVLTEMFNEFRKIKPDRILFLGDLLHSKNQTSSELFEITSWVLTECANIADTVILLGNHDANLANLQRLSPLQTIVNIMQNDKIKLFKNSGVYIDENLAYCVWGLFSNNEKPNIEEFKSKNPNLKYIGMFHGPVKGLKTDLNFIFENGYDIDNFNECDFVLLGDIHKRQILETTNGVKCFEIGSTIIQDYGEKINGHGFLVYDITKDEYEFIDLHNDNTLLEFKIMDIKDIETGEEILVNI